MTDNETTSPSRRKQRLAGAVGLLLAGGIAGGALAAGNSASAASTPTPTTSSSAAAPGARAPADTATPVRPGEKAETGTNLTTLKAAALKAVPGGTVFRVETDADGSTYEAHMTKADGTHVTVKFDANLKVTAVQAGMGSGGPGRPGGPGGGAHLEGQGGPAAGTPTTSGTGV